MCAYLYEKWYIYIYIYIYICVCVCVCVYEVILFTNPSARAGYNTRSIFKWSLTGLNSEFSFSWTSCQGWRTQSVHLFTHSWRENSRIHTFPKLWIQVLCEMQSASSRIWTRVTVSISYNDNHYTTGTSTCIWSDRNVTSRNLEKQGRAH